MRNFKKVFALALPVFGILAYGIVEKNVNAEGDHTSTETTETEDFPQGLKYLVPPPVPVFSDPARSVDTEHVAYGAVDPNEELAQPIAYSHKLHAGELQIDCQYCHTYAKRSKHAGVPSTQICMNCHGFAPNGQGRVDPTKVKEGGSPELYKLLSYNYGAEEAANKISKGDATVKQAVLDAATITDDHGTSHLIEQGPIPWVKVHDLPDFVTFTHKRHVKAGLACQECHGEVQDDMTVARRVSELTMGWCLNCHESHPSIQENYCSADELQAAGTCEKAELRRTEIKDCYTCHQ